MMGHGSKVIMNLSEVKLICKDLGNVKKFSQNTELFGNIDLELITFEKISLYISSDRGEFLCYVKKGIHLIPIDNIIDSDGSITFTSLLEVVNYLKDNLRLIETKCR